MINTVLSEAINEYMVSKQRLYHKHVHLHQSVVLPGAPHLTRVVQGQLGKVAVRDRNVPVGQLLHTVQANTQSIHVIAMG